MTMQNKVRLKPAAVALGTLGLAFSGMGALAGWSGYPPYSPFEMIEQPVEESLAPARRTVNEVADQVTNPAESEVVDAVFKPETPRKKLVSIITAPTKLGDATTKSVYGEPKEGPIHEALEKYGLERDPVAVNDALHHGTNDLREPKEGGLREPKEGGLERDPVADNDRLHHGND